MDKFALGVVVTLLAVAVCSCGGGIITLSLFAIGFVLGFSLKWASGTTQLLAVILWIIVAFHFGMTTILTGILVGFVFLEVLAIAAIVMVLIFED